MEKFKLIIDDKGQIQFYMDGHLIKGVRAIDFNWEIGEIPYHKVEFATQATKFERKYSQD